VIGAGHRADAGRSAEEILKFYFPALAIESYHSSAITTVSRTATSARSSPIDSRDDVLVALPGQEETERARLVQLIRTARDDIAAASGAKPPTAIRVTVHPTVEAFGRATGQPWWVSAATDGAEIDLLPLSILRQQGQLERTVRHEVAHVLIDSALKGRPLWVREGAAFYFADPNATQTPQARTACPRDEEFLRPISAGTHRAAYARAEACFRKAIADGKRWQNVR
jgi:hypothetical protein